MEEIPRQLQADWISALRREDGYRLMILLGQEPRLVTVKHRGCNVLHLAMRNNWYGLVREILQKFNHLHKEAASPISGTSLPSSSLKAANAEQEHNIDAPSFLGGPSNSQGSEAAEVGRSGALSPSSSLKAANAAQDHNMDAPPLLGGPLNSQSSEAADHRQITRELKSCPTGDSQAPPDEHGTKHGSALDLAAFRDLLVAKEGFVGAHKGKKKAAKQGDGESSTEDTKILSDIPKASGFDVFAMAVIKGHEAINKMLVEAVSQVDSLFDKVHPYRNVIRRIAEEEERVRRSARPGDSDPHDRERELLGELIYMAEIDVATWDSKRDIHFQISKRLTEFYAKVPDSSRLSSSCPATNEQGVAADSSAREQDNPGTSSRNLKNGLEDKLHRTWWEQWKLISPFLHFEEFLFLAYCLHPSVFLADPGKYQQVRVNAWRLLAGCAKHMKTGKKSFVKYLLSINDTWGSAIHHGLLSEQRDSYIHRDFLLETTPLELVLRMIPDHELSRYVNEGDSLGRTPLHIAVALGLQQGIRTLLGENKARSLLLETKENCGRLRIADCEWEIDVNIVSQVNGCMPYKVSKNRIAKYRRTPFQLAIHSPHLRQPERQAVIRLLLDMPDGEREEVSQLLLDMAHWLPRRLWYGMFGRFMVVDGNEVMRVLLDMTEGEAWSLGVELATVATPVGDLKAMVHSRRLRTPLQLAAFLGDAAAVQILAHHPSTGCDTARLDNFFLDWVVYHFPSWPWSWVPSLRRGSLSPFKSYIRDLYRKDRKSVSSALHVAAMGAHPHVIRSILASGKFDPLVQDLSGNTALHFALRCEVPEQVAHVLADFCEIPSTRIGTRDDPQRSLSAVERRELESRRQGCVNLLLQAGIDAWQTNKKHEIADPGPKASPEYSTWWYEKLSKETLEAKTSLSTAANAVSVTAALVATASYVGPLQPPLGYAAPSEGLVVKMQVDVLSVRVFIVCNTLAFYLALAAIVLSLTPALPMPQESLLDELRLIRRTVTAAVFLLVLSIFAVLLAFGFASIAVIPDEGSWNHGGLTASTLGVGGFVCSMALLLCLFRLFRLLFHKSRFMRMLYRKFVPM